MADSKGAKPMNIASPRRPPDELDDIVGTPGRGTGTPGTPRGLRPTGTPSTPTIPNIPPRGGGMSYGSPAGLGLGLPASRTSPAVLRPRTPQTQTPGGVGSPGASNNGTEGQRNLDEVTDEELARVVRRHLVSRSERQNRFDSPAAGTPDLARAGNDSGENTPGIAGNSDVPSLHSSRSKANLREDSEPFPIPYDAPGGDITHSIYKWQADKRKATGRSRAASFSGPSTEPLHSPHPAFEHIHEPGGFRRNYVMLRADDQGGDDLPVSSNFIEFLYLFGHFAGEDLEEEEEEELEAEILPSVADHIGFVGASADRLIADTTKPSELSESSPLLRREGTSRSLSRIRRRRRSSVGPHGDATVTQAVLMLLKGFVGTGVLFLGKAFMNGGILFSTVTLVAIALISLWSFLLLVKAKQVVHGSFGDIGGALYGPWMRYAILSSIVVSQLGFVCAYIIFVSENLQAFVLAITDCARSIPVQYLILSQLIIFMPLALIRNLAKLSTTALIADAFILAGLLYIFGSEFSLIAKRGVAKVELFNPKDFPLLIGTAVFSFEGIGLVIPISDAMRDPSRFPGVLTSVMIFLTFLFGGAGALAYAAFGSEIQTVVIVNLDAESKLVQAVQLLYSLAILLSAPLQLFPAVRIMENGLFVSSGKQDLRVKWQKNTFRFLTVMFCAVVSWIGAADLDKFVALVGSFACVPLCYLYPPMLHYKACARTRKAKIADVALMIFGAVAAVYTTAQTIRLMAQPAPDGSPKFGRCDIPPALLA